MLRSRWALGTTSTIIYLKVNRHYSFSLSISVSHPPFLCLSPFLGCVRSLALLFHVLGRCFSRTTFAPQRISPPDIFPSRRRRVRHAKRHLVNDDRPWQNARAMTSETMTHHRATATAVTSSAGEASLPRFLGTTSWSTARRFRSSSLLVSRLAVPSRLSLPPPDSAVLSPHREKRPRFIHYVCNWARYIHVSNTCDGVISALPIVCRAGIHVHA